MSFSLIQEEAIPEIASYAKLYVHEQTGARILSLTNQDENKVFGINFRTPPFNSNGIAHILEHSVLCGSEKYPVKEPFIEIIKGSLQTFVNAFTYPDKTCYPCASQNLQDLYNLIDIYLDAVLHPKITEMTLRQEGWHYELADPNAPLTYKGVVFNEMKGAYSSPEDLLMDQSRISLFPDNAYGFDSGGDPLVIPNLTYAQFKEFHENYYHPSNSFVYFYGDDPEEKRLEIIDNAFKGFSAKAVNSTISNQKDFSAPVRKKLSYDSAGAEDAKNYLTKNWKISSALETSTSTAFELLEHALMATPASYVKRRLLESGLGEDIVGGFESELGETMFTIGLKGIKTEDIEKVDKLIDEILEDVIREGIDQETILASLNTLEFQSRELNTGRFPRGLALMLTALRVWIYGGDPIDALKFEEDFKTLRAKIADKTFLPAMVGKYLLENNNASTITLIPDPAEGARRASIENEALRVAKQAMTLEEINKVMAIEKALKLHQETPDSEEALATIPALSLEDLNRTGKNVSSSQSAQIIHHDIPTNGIFYLDIGFDLSVVPERLIPYVGMLGKVLLEMGTQKRDFIHLSQRIGLQTGGIKSANLISEKFRKNERGLYFFLRSKVLPANTEHLIDLLAEIINEPNLDQKDRFKQLVAERRSGLEAGLIPSGHITINQRLRSHFTLADHIQERITGLDQIYFLRSLSAQIDKEWDYVLADLRELFSALINKNGVIVNTTCDQDIRSATLSGVQSLLSTLPTVEIKPKVFTLPGLPINEAFTLPSQVNYVGSGYQLFQNGLKPSGSLMVVNNYLQTTYLWDRVRVQGGAYGGFSAYDPYTGNFNFLSYRDPNITGTIDTYDGTAEFLKSLKISDSELRKGIIAAIGDLDSYQLPDAKGWSKLNRILFDLSDEQRQQTRDEVFATTVADFNHFGEFLANIQSTSHQVVLGSSKAIGEAGTLKGNEIKISNIL